ncbi:MAG: DEAD/DEAH box helicase [Saprospiraceae bacterium]|nr:DEAD/DEAH box helicase [Saprospiraceae bacterium]
MQTFQTLGLAPDIFKAISAMGFEIPTPVQAKAIPQLLASDQDLIAYAQTGTGKTAAFSLPIIQKLNMEDGRIQALVLCPTRELCIQTSNEIKKFIQFMPNVSIVSVYGGDAKEKQLRSLKSGAHIVVGTPGRVHDFIRSRQLNFSAVRWLVLDEADEMLSMGFKDDLDAILSTTPNEKQTLLFSATMPSEMQTIVRTYMRNPIEINAGTQNVSAENIKHLYSVVKATDKYAALKRILDVNPDIYGIVFCRTRMDTKEIADKLIEDDYSADALHGDLSQPQREHVMKRFRAKQLQVLVATDVAARGLDINNLSHVIHYYLPDQLETYIHRSGRTGRAGKSGVSVAIITGRDKQKIQAIEKSAGIKIAQKDIPTGSEICEKRLLHFVDNIHQIEVEEAQIAPYMLEMENRLKDISKEEIVKRLAFVEFNQFLNYYRNAIDLNVGASSAKPIKERGEKGKRQERTAFSRFFINLGQRHQLDPGKLIKLLNKEMEGSGFEIGKIEILRNFSFFEIDSNYEQNVIKAFRDANWNGEPISVEVSKDKAPSSQSSGDRGDRGREREFRPRRDRDNKRSNTDSRNAAPSNFKKKKKSKFSNNFA